MSKKTWSMILAVGLLAAAAASAQEKEKSEHPRKTLTPLRLQVVFSRSQGEKKISSTPYTLSVSADDRPAKLRMGIQVPIQVKDVPGQVVYKDVGNNLDCSAEALGDGRFKVMCSFEQSSVYSAEGERRPTGSAVGDVSLGSVPLFRMFRSDANLLLRDGQSALYTMATDPVSGEVLKVEMTLNVVK